MKYCILGAGLMGRAAAYDLLQQPDTISVILADNNESNLQEASKFLNDKRLSVKIIDAKNSSHVETVLSNADAAIAAIHYGFNLDFTKAAIKTKTHICDLGGNSSIVDKQLELNSEARESGISVIPDCGLAPGMASVLVKWGIEKFNWVDSVKIRVGGLPQNPTGPLNYERLFSVEGLINEYVEPVRVLRNGKIEIVEPLTEIESINFPAPYGKCEAFTTSGGVSTLVESYKNKLKNLDYKTIRYPGHCNEIRKLYGAGLFSGEHRKLTASLLEKTIPLCKEDVTLVKIIFEGNSNKHELTIIDKCNLPFTSMMRMTAFSAAIISSFQAKGLIKAGVQTQENCIPTDLFMEELKLRKVEIKGI